MNSNTTNSRPNLTESDFQRLHKFGITDACLLLHQVRRITDRQARENYGLKGEGNFAGVIFPTFDADRTIRNYRVRRDHPGQGKKKGKLDRKYVCRPGQTYLSFELNSLQYLSDASIPVIFVEAHSSAMALWCWCERTQQKFLIVATCGCWCWRGTVTTTDSAGKPIQKKGPLACLDRIDFKGRQAVICFDSNIQTGMDVQAAAKAFSSELTKRGARVRVVVLPNEPGLNGPDDFLMLHSDDELTALVTEAKPTAEIPFLSMKHSQADHLVDLAKDIELFHADIDQPFATIRVGDHFETRSIHSKSFAYFLAQEYHKKFKKTPGTQAVRDALGVLAGYAIHVGKRIPVHIRVAEHGGNIYLDLADDTWRAVEITTSGWRVIQDPPVKFRRCQGMDALPEPSHGGSVNDLLPFLNLEDTSSFVLVKACLIAAFRAGLPFPVLVFCGEHGSAKSSQGNTCKGLIDPSTAEMGGLPKTSRDLAIRASHEWLLAFDNVSKISPEQSDDLCRLASGGALRTRQLFTDEDEKIFSFKRPIILTGIGDIVTRPDLLDRSLIEILPIIPDEKRREEKELRKDFKKARPGILGGLLDAVSTALRNHPSVKLGSLPRMADFATWSHAAEPAHTEEKDRGAFVRAYTISRQELDQTAIDTSTIGPYLIQLLNGREKWVGIFQSLLKDLNSTAPEKVQKTRGMAENSSWTIR